MQRNRPAAPAELTARIGAMVDAAWLLKRYPDLALDDADPVSYFVRQGEAEQRDPNAFFDSQWYRRTYPDVTASGFDPLTHYLLKGIIAGNDPHPRFDAAWYVERHPSAAANPVLYHLRVGRHHGYATEPFTAISECLPSTHPLRHPPRGVFADIIVQLHDDLSSAQRCLSAILARRALPLARIIVFEPPRAEAALTAWLEELAAEGQIFRIPTRRAQRAAFCLNRGSEVAEGHDIIWIDASAEVSLAALGGLAAHARAAPRVATVSPLCNRARPPLPSLAAFGLSGPEVETICRTVNAGRATAIPAPEDACVYIRRDALHAIGGFRDTADPIGDFARRATDAGWRHHLAADCLAWRDEAAHATRPGSRPTDLTERPRRPEPLNHRSERNDPSSHALAAAHFAITAAIFRQSRLPVVLMVCHAAEGPVRRHIDDLARRYAARARVLLLIMADRGITLSVPTADDHPRLHLRDDGSSDSIEERAEERAVLLRSAGVTRVHIHQSPKDSEAIRALIGLLAVPLDVTVHDYQALCPQATLLPMPEGSYCGEPGPATCNACIAASGRAEGQDIVRWRQEHGWMFVEAERVICPSADARSRLARFGIRANSILAPHQTHAPGPWPVALRSGRTARLRVAFLGDLTDETGGRIVASLAEATRPDTMSFHVLGAVAADFPAGATYRIEATGPCAVEELPTLLSRLKPHVLCFPASAPITYGETLTAAINSGLPIVASNLGALPERLSGRPNTWLIPDRAPCETWLAAFAAIRERLRDPRTTPIIRRPDPPVDFYASDYLAPARPRRTVARRPRIVIVPERSDRGDVSPSASIRLLHPFGHPAIGGDCDVLLADRRSVFNHDADLIVTHRHAVTDFSTADRLVRHARATGAKLLYDLDEDLLPGQGASRGIRRKDALADTVQHLLKHADAVWVASEDIARRLGKHRPDAVIVPSRHDERLWPVPPPTSPCIEDPVRILLTTAGLRDRDLAMIAPILLQLQADYGERLMIDAIVLERPPAVLSGLHRIVPPVHALRSYPAFVDWITGVRPGWHIGLAPLCDTPADITRAETNLLEYSALGLATLVSDVPAYRGAIADGRAGQVVRNDATSWHAALDWMIRNHAFRRGVAATARPAWEAHGTLLAAAELHRTALAALLPAGGLQAAATGLIMQNDPTDTSAGKRGHRRRG